MKILMLLRHGKSNWRADYTGDHERPLASRGRKAARAMGKWLASTQPLPNHILCSTARRTRLTCDHFLRGAKADIPVTYACDLYDASVEEVVRLVRNAGGDFQNLLLIGHEPTSSATVAWCTGRAVGHFPTAALAQISFNIDHWRDIAQSQGKLVRFQVPRALP